MLDRRPALRVSIRGPVGSGKTTLVAILCEQLRARYSMAVVTSDIGAREDARHLARIGSLASDRIVGLDGGSCSHTTVADDGHRDRVAVEALVARHHPLDIVLIEARDDRGDDAFDPQLADLGIYVIDVAGGEKAARRGDPLIATADLLVINKTDLAPAVGVSLMNVERDAIAVRQDRPHIFTDLRGGDGVDKVRDFIVEHGMLESPGGP